MSPRLHLHRRPPSQHSDRNRPPQRSPRCRPLPTPPGPGEQRALQMAACAGWADSTFWIDAWTSSPDALHHLQPPRRRLRCISMLVHHMHPASKVSSQDVRLTCNLDERLYASVTAEACKLRQGRATYHTGVSSSVKGQGSWLVAFPPRHSIQAPPVPAAQAQRQGTAECVSQACAQKAMLPRRLLPPPARHHRTRCRSCRRGLEGSSSAEAWMVSRPRVTVGSPPGALRVPSHHWHQTDCVTGKQLPDRVDRGTAILPALPFWPVSVDLNILTPHINSQFHISAHNWKGLWRDALQWAKFEHDKAQSRLAIRSQSSQHGGTGQVRAVLPQARRPFQGQPSDDLRPRHRQ